MKDIEVNNMSFFMGEPFTLHADMFGTTLRAPTFRAGENCEGDDDCPEGNKCSKGNCVKECENDSDCPSWQDCVRGSCREEETDAFEQAKNRSQGDTTATEAPKTKSNPMNPLTLGLIGVGVCGLGWFAYDSWVKNKTQR